jgi:hypothetical protein
MTQRAYNQEMWARARFRKSRRSNGGSSGNCVEIGYVDGTFGVRDSKLGDESPIFAASAADFARLIVGIKSGEIL